MTIIKLVNTFDKLFKKGYCEEDILEAFAACLERRRVSEDFDDVGEFSATILMSRIDDLMQVAKKWDGQNEKMMEDFDLGIEDFDDEEDYLDEEDI